jgi:predicted ATPase
MYINKLIVDSFRTFRQAEVEFLHPDQDFTALEFPRPPRLPNVNLLLGNNGSGKTTLLKAIALAALGPSVTDSGIFPYRLVRREPAAKPVKVRAGTEQSATLEATFAPHPQDGPSPLPAVLESQVTVTRKFDTEQLRWTRSDETGWQSIFSSESDAFFFVGYGATRRVESRERIDLGARKSSSSARAQRVRSLFEDAYSLIPLNVWLPQLQHTNPGRHTQVVHLIHRLLGREHYDFKGEQEDGEYVFEKGGLKVPFPALSDGYRAYLGWVCDLLYHVCQTCPSGKKLVDNRGIVMVDEIDLHLHPEWQMTVLPTLAKRLPNLQFIVTSHSPLVVGSLEWMNILVMSSGPKQSSRPRRLPRPVHGLNADQVLLTDFFGMASTRAPGKQRQLKQLTLQAREGDTEAAKKLLDEMSRGVEGVQ